VTPPKLKTGKTLLFILIVASLTMSLIQSAFPQSASNTTVAVNPGTVSAIIDETVTVNVTVSNVQNLYGLDVTLMWNPSILTVQNIDIRLGVESFPDGVLHEAPDAEIFIQENIVDQENGEFHLVATSVAPASAFSGSGNIASLTFNVTSIGQSELILMTELADYNPSGSNLIDHTDVNGSLESVIPEFSSIIAVILIMFLVTTTAVLSRRILGKPNSKPKKRQ